MIYIGTFMARAEVWSRCDDEALVAEDFAQIQDKGAEMLEAAGFKLFDSLLHFRDGGESRLIARWPGWADERVWTDGRIEGAKTLAEANERWLDSFEIPL